MIADAVAAVASSTLGGGKKSTGHLQEGFKDMCGRCGARRVDAQLGLEATPTAYVAALVAVFAEVWRVLRADGTLWLNLGDSYNAYNGNAKQGGPVSLTQSAERPRLPSGYGLTAKELKPKDLVGIPWRVAFALQDAGWYLRSDIIWSKPNPMPESVTDRPTKAHEYVFLLAKQPKYFFDADAIREPHTTPLHHPGNREKRFDKDGTHSWDAERMDATWGNPAGRNARSVWEIATQPTPEAHFACVDDQTQALTTSGWRYHHELVDGDSIAAYDPKSGTVRFLKSTFHRYPYDGELVAIEKRDTSQRLTPNHRCVIRRGGKEIVVLAEELRAKHDLRLTAPFQPHTGAVERGAVMALLGWYIAEGWKRSSHTVGISQSETANPVHVNTIRSLLLALNADYTERRRERVWEDRPSVEIEWAVRGTVAEQLCGLAPDKRLTATVAAFCRVPDAQLLLDALIDGDGHRRDDGRSCIIQKDADHIDLMQLLALRLGYRAHVSRREDGCYVLYLTTGEWLTMRGTNGTHDEIPREHYEGIVWCPNTPTGFWLARRNGKPFVTGNTFPEALVRRCILAGTSEAGGCSVCGAPWQRQTETERVPHAQPPGRGKGAMEVNNVSPSSVFRTGLVPRTTTMGWAALCQCGAPPVPQTVLDPFVGSGTTALVARKHGRRAIGIDLSSEYLEIASRRLAQQSLFA